MRRTAAEDVKKIVFACEAGAGSSLMGANSLKKKVKKAKLDIEVVHAPVNQLPSDTDVIVTHQGLAKRASSVNETAPIIAFKMFLNDPAIERLVADLIAGNDVTSP